MPPKLILQHPSAPCPFSLTPASPALRRVESFLSAVLLPPPPWLHSHWEQNSWQVRVAACQLPADGLLGRDTGSFQGYLGRQVRGVPAGEEQGASQKARRGTPGQEPVERLVKQGRGEEEVRASPETPGGLRQ